MKISEKANDLNWMSVNKGLPEERVPVLIFTIYGEIFSAKLLAGVWVGLFRDFREDEVTHWMPLPNPPVEEDKNE